MHKRLTRLAASLAALAALAFGGSALASAAQKSHTSSPPPATATQPADQTAADNPAGSQAGAADTDNIQQGDQAGSDTADQAEQASSETAASDGPGGYADTNPNADTQQTGEH